jgi:hypothetical protein
MMNARDIIDRLATLDEATVAEPEVEPDVMPAEPSAPPAPSRPRREPAPDPWSVPPDFEPDQMPRPKAEDETESIESWLEATQQPIRDWEWDGQELRLLLDDGSTESYTRQQLDEIGVFGQMAFAESEEPPTELALDDRPPSGPDEDATGTLDAILGRNGECGCEGGAEEMISVEGEAAEKLTQGISDVVAGILGIVAQVAGEEGGEEGHSDYEDFYAKKGDEKPKKKKDSEKSDGSDSKKSDEKDGKKDDDKE